jgi:hypothetical protein
MSAAEQLPVEDDDQEHEEHPHLELVEEPGKLAALCAELRPYLPTRSALAGPLAGVGAGSAVLLGKGWKWLWEDGPREAGIRAGGVALGTYAGAHAVSVAAGPYVGYSIPAAVVAWVVAAKHYAPADAKAAAKPVGKSAPADRCSADGAADEPVPAPESGPEELPAIEAGEVVALIRAVAARHEHQGAHLEDLLAEPLFEGWEKADLKAALLDEWDLPVESFKLIYKTPQGRTQRVRDGVRLRHLPQPPAEGAGEGPARGLSVVPSEPPAVVLFKAPVEAAASPSPPASEGPPQSAG